MSARIQHVELHAEDDGLNPGEVMLKVENVSLSSVDLFQGRVTMISR